MEKEHDAFSITKKKYIYTTNSFGLNCPTVVYYFNREGNQVFYSLFKLDNINTLKTFSLYCFTNAHCVWNSFSQPVDHAALLLLQDSGEDVPLSVCSLHVTDDNYSLWSLGWSHSCAKGSAEALWRTRWSFLLLWITHFHLVVIE